MEVFFSKKSLAKSCNESKTGRQRWGESLAKKIFQRLTELRAAENLAEISTLPPPRCHALTGNREGEFAVDLTASKRLVFKPEVSPLPLLEDGGLDLSQISRIKILEVIDYHGT